MADPTLTRRRTLAFLITLMVGSAFGATDAEAATDDDDDDDFDDGPHFEHFVVHGVAIGDGDLDYRPVIITFRPGGEPTIVKVGDPEGGLNFTAISDDRATRDLYGAIFGT
jgi:hypothetical protein